MQYQWNLAFFSKGAINSLDFCSDKPSKGYNSTIKYTISNERNRLTRKGRVLYKLNICAFRTIRLSIKPTQKISISMNCFMTTFVFFWTDHDKLCLKIKKQWKKKKWKYGNHGPRVALKQKHPLAWSSGIMPPPLLVSITSNSFTTSSISGRFSGFASQHFLMMFATELGQHLGISGRRFYQR